MKRTVLILLLLGIPVLGVIIAYDTLPQYYYDQLVHGKTSHELYTLKRWDQRYLTPGVKREVGEPNNDFPGLWREFHLQDVVVPLPTGHPMYRTIPIIKIIEGQSRPQLGIQLNGPQGREIARLYLLKSGTWSDQLDGQKLFQLPLVRKILKRRSSELVWQDLFTRRVEGWDLPWSIMLYNLYLVHLRSMILPPDFVDYGPLDKEGTAFIELPSANKDYRTELVLTFDRGLLLSFLMVTEINNPDSQDVRARWLKGLSFRTSDPGIAPLVYREFKQLTFNRQTDQEGMLYLLSSWSHDVDNNEILKEMVYFMERGEKNGPQLRPIYRYIYDRYQKTYTTRSIGLEEDEPEIRLQREIELEAISERQKLLQRPKPAPKVEEVTPRERMEEYLKKAREEKIKRPKKSRDKIIVH